MSSTEYVPDFSAGLSFCVHPIAPEKRGDHDSVISCVSSPLRTISSVSENGAPLDSVHLLCPLYPTPVEPPRSDKNTATIFGADASILYVIFFLKLSVLYTIH